MSICNITTPEQCLAFFDKEHAHAHYGVMMFQAFHFYIDNPFIFDNQQTLQLFSSELFKQQIKPRYTEELYKKCIKEQKTLPIFMLQMFNNIKTFEKENYISILYKEKNYSQIRDVAYYFCTIVENYILKQDNPSLELNRILVDLNETNILFVKNVNFVFDYLKFDKGNFINIVSNIDTDNQEQTIMRYPLVKTFIYNKLIDYFIAQNEPNFDTEKHTYFLTFLEQFDFEYIEKFMEKEPYFFETQLKKDFLCDSKDFQTTSNLLQYIYHYKSELGDKKYCLSLLENFLDIILPPIKENIFNYTTEMDILEFHLRKKNNHFITPFVYHFDKLNLNQKHIVTASVFQTISKTQTSSLHLLIPIIEQIPYFYCEKLLEKTHLSEDKIKFIQQIVFKQKMDDNLNHKDNKRLHKI